MLSLTSINYFYIVAILNALFVSLLDLNNLTSQSYKVALLFMHEIISACRLNGVFSGFLPQKGNRAEPLSHSCIEVLTGERISCKTPL